MEELIYVVEELSQKDWVDYFQIFTPILLSLVAIGISLAIAYRQNRIALFAMRYRALLQFKTIVRFGENIYNTDSAEVIRTLFDMFFATDIRRQDDIPALMKAMQQLTTVEQDVAALFFVVDENHRELFYKMLKSLSEIIIAAIDGHVNEKEKEELHLMCEEFNNSIYDELIKKIKV